ncbi:MAG: hypothetical protein ACRETX_11410 [Steroidobacteraceae bacterium]
MQIITIGARFCGPPDSGNGGYVAGMLAGQSLAQVRVRLCKPPPLNAPLIVHHLDDGRLELKRDRDLIAEAERHQLQLQAPSAPSYVDALNASRGYSGFRQHPYPTCFVCGPQRMRGDGLRIFPGAWGDDGSVAAPWMPDESLCGADGKVCSEFMWAALDCPGYFAAVDDGRRLLLGQIAAQVDRRVHAAESCVVVGWKLGREGRKHIVGTALYDDDGEPCARAVATWIEVRG